MLEKCDQEFDDYLFIFVQAEKHEESIKNTMLVSTPPWQNVAERKSQTLNYPFAAASEYRQTK